MINETHIADAAVELELKPGQVEAVAKLLDEDATVPFIARYRKEVTGNLDEVQVTAIRDRLHQLRELADRKDAVLKSLEQHGHLTDELKEQVLACGTLTELEDLYLPYRPKRRTRATIAREKGLDPLAVAIFAQSGIDPLVEAEQFVDPEKGVETAEDALAGARDIIAEQINEDAEARQAMRNLFMSKATIKSTVASGKDKEGAKYRDYFEWEEPAAGSPSHRVLAMRRGEKEDILNLSILPPEEEAIELLHGLFVTAEGPDAEQIGLAVKDCYKRLLSRSMETEIRVATKTKADEAAIKVFAENLRELLLDAPMGAKNVLGIDPGFRTGCKVVCLDRQGKLIHYETLYFHRSEKEDHKALTKLQGLAEKYGVEAIAVGNGTAGRETLNLARKLEYKNPVQVVMVNESGASIYSASQMAREEFPDLDLTVRGSVSIGRRLMDPLAELVKIDPKSIGVGQYQHDVDQTDLKQALDDVVMSCVNGVGVDLNRASGQLLTYVSGLGPRLAKNIVVYRDENGPFASRKSVKNVPRLGPKAFEQAAGFLRIPDGENPLDASAVHPESYHIVDTMAGDLGCTVHDLIGDAALREKINLDKYVTDAVGRLTLKDIVDELAKPGRDPRKSFEAFEYAEDVEKMEDLLPGMRLPGTVTNVTAFGAFVDVGVHQDGLVHISQLADRFVKDPAEVVKVNQKVTVTVMEVDLDRKRIGLSMKSQPGEASGKKPQKKKVKKVTPQKPKQQQKREKKPFHNPFAEAFAKKK
jgi:protein Tex